MQFRYPEQPAKSAVFLGTFCIVIGGAVAPSTLVSRHFADKCGQAGALEKESMCGGCHIPICPRNADVREPRDRMRVNIMGITIADPPRPNPHQLIKQIADWAAGAILISTVPIYCDDDSDWGLDLHRTGVLIRLGPERFILTASHHISRYLQDGTLLYTDISQHTGLPIPLDDCRFYGTEVDDASPDRDVAVIHLDPDAVSQFYPQRNFLSLADCGLSVKPAPALYLVAGYPWDWYQMTPVAGGPAMLYFGNMETRSRMKNVDPGLHLVLSIDGEWRRATDFEFVSDRAQEFQGMSGCGIWRVAPSTMVNPDSWDPSMVRLAAIQNRCQSDLIGTWVKHAVDRIIADVPSLKSAIEIEYPPGY